jgi:hypothetical protein
MVFCLFCHWTKVEPGTNCPNCNTYMPKPSAVPRDTPDRNLRRSLSLRRREASTGGLLVAVGPARRGRTREA